jgi:uncharacterized protein
MNIQLDAIEARILGSLMEKSVVTPDQYPLSLNALVNACNQKSSRDPVMDLTEAEVQDAVDALRRRYLVREQSGFGSRVVKYHYRLGNDEIGGFRFSDAERAVVCLLLLRGPQTPGELRARSGRLHEFAGIDEGGGDPSESARRRPRPVRGAAAAGAGPARGALPAPVHRRSDHRFSTHRAP